MGQLSGQPRLRRHRHPERRWLQLRQVRRGWPYPALLLQPVRRARPLRLPARRRDRRLLVAITSGDTSLRSLRLTISELFHLDQSKISNRLCLTIPIFALCLGLIFWSNLNPDGFNILWNYFSWSNQVMAVCSLCVTTVYLACKKKNFWIAVVPTFFMAFIVFAYILWVSPENLKGAPVGFGLPYSIALIVALLLSAALSIWLVRRGKKLARDEKFIADE